MSLRPVRGLVDEAGHRNRDGLGAFIVESGLARYVASWQSSHGSLLAGA